jgi:phosphomannomutase
LHDSGKDLSAIVREYPAYAIVKEKLPLLPGPLSNVYEALAGAFPDASRDNQDGLRLAWTDSWLHVRPSGTEPIVRVIAEAPSLEAANALVSRARELIATG